MNKNQWLVYLVRCSDETLYCGITNNLQHRLELHNSGKGAKYTRSRLPVTLVGVSPKMTKSDALKLEYRIKKMPADKKTINLLKEEPIMATKIATELSAVKKKLAALTKKIDKIEAALGKAQKSKPAPKKKAAPKKQATKKPAAKASVSDSVLGFINRSKKGVSMADLKKKTGLADKQLQNIVFRLKKQGKVKAESRGIYVKA